jgi:hypothetical protein
MPSLIVEGTSSCGKTSITKLAAGCRVPIALDDISFSEVSNRYHQRVPNEYISEDDRAEMRVSIYYELVVEQADGRDFVFDTVPMDGGIELRNRFMPKDKLNILVYASLPDLVRNLNARRNTDARGRFVFKQYRDLYGTKKKRGVRALDKIDIATFIESLKDIKYEFDSEEELVTFAKQIFKDLGIEDEKPLNIYPRCTEYDIILNTRGKTVRQCAEELQDRLAS